MPFAAARRHQYWSVDVRYVEDHALGTGKPAYAISVLDNFSRALLASAISPRQDLTAYLIVLRAAVEVHGAPEVLVSDSGSVPGQRDARCHPEQHLRKARRRLWLGRVLQFALEPVTDHARPGTRHEVRDVGQDA